MHKIQNVSSYLVKIFTLILIGLPLLIGLQWMFIDTSIVKSLIAHGNIGNFVQTPEGVIFLNEVSWTLISKILGFVSSALASLPFFLSLFSLKIIFRNYQKNKIFTTENAGQYRYLGWLLFFDALLAQPLSYLLMVLAVTLSNPPGHRYITLDFGTPNMESIFWGILVIVVSWVMGEASKLQEEQKFII